MGIICVGLGCYALQSLLHFNTKMIKTIHLRAWFIMVKERWGVDIRPVLLYNLFFDTPSNFRAPILRNGLLMPVLIPTPPKKKPAVWNIRSAIHLAKSSRDRSKKPARMQIPVISNREMDEIFPIRAWLGNTTINIEVIEIISLLYGEFY